MLIDKNIRKNEPKVYFKIDVKDGDDTTVYWFIVNRIKDIDQFNLAMDSTDDPQSMLKATKLAVESVKPAEDKGTTVSFRGFLTDIVPDYVTSVLESLGKVMNADTITLKTMDGVEVIEG